MKVLRLCAQKLLPKLLYNAASPSFPIVIFSLFFPLITLMITTVGLTVLCSLSPSTGQLAVGTCEIVMLNRDSSQPRRTIARQTARCACRRGQIAGTTRARPACVDGECRPTPGVHSEGCQLLLLFH